MAASVSFNGKAINHQLDLLVRKQLPFIASKTLQGLAQAVKKDLQHEMVDTFTYLKPFTYTSVGIKASTKYNLVTEIFHKDMFSKGNQPAEYLKPLVTGGKVFPTRFQRRLQMQGMTPGSSLGAYLMPIHGAPGTSTTKEGRLANTEYIKALWGIRAMEDLRSSGKYGKQNYKTLGTYVRVPSKNNRDWIQDAPALANAIRAANKASGGKWELPKGAGIYKPGSSGLVQVFKQLDRIPTVPKDYYLFNLTGEVAVERNYERIFKEQVQKYAHTGLSAAARTLI